MLKYAPGHLIEQEQHRPVRLAGTEGFAVAGQDVVMAAGVPFSQAGMTNAARECLAG